MLKKLLFFLIACISSQSFADPEIVYLASFPRSGNHWVRFLIEEASLIATSSTYKDREHPHTARFSWGYSTDHGYQGSCRYPTENEPVVLKTHYPYLVRPFLPVQRAAVCLIRHPADAFRSFYMYKKKQNVKERIPESILIEFIQKWKEFYEFWEAQDGVLFVRYEDLYENPKAHLSQILQTIGYFATSEDIERAVNKFPPQGGILKHLDQYQKADLNLMKTELNDIMVKYGYVF